MAQIIRVSIHGTMPSGEVWSVNPTFDVNATPEITGADLAAAAAGICTVSLPAGLKVVMSQRVTWTGAVVEARTYAGELTARGEALRSSVEAGTGAPGLPFQASLVASLVTSVAGGRGRGRLYWPALGPILDPNTVRVDSTTLTGFVSGMETFLGAIEAELDEVVEGGTALAVWSRASASGALVTKIRAGDVVDTQRRRRDTVPETYVEVPYDS